MSPCGCNTEIRYYKLLPNKPYDLKLTELFFNIWLILDRICSSLISLNDEGTETLLAYSHQTCSCHHHKITTTLIRSSLKELISIVHTNLCGDGTLLNVWSNVGLSVKPNIQRSPGAISTEIIQIYIIPCDVFYLACYLYTLTR